MKKSAIREKSIRGENCKLVKKKGGVVWNLSSAVSFLLLGKGGLEVCGYGHWQDIPLDVCTRVYTRICWTLSPSLAGWNDLETRN